VSPADAIKREASLALTIQDMSALMFTRLVSLQGGRTNSLTRSRRKSHECAVGAAGFRREGGA
jgi:hypothetical protein